MTATIADHPFLAAVQERLGSIEPDVPLDRQTSPRQVTNSLAYNQISPWLRPVLEKWSGILGIDIDFHTGNSWWAACRPSKSKTKLLIRAGVTKNFTGTIAYARTAYGIDIGGSAYHRGFRYATGDGLLIADKQGNVVAELIGSTLYILFHIGVVERDAELLDRILTSMSDMIGISNTQVRSLLSRLERERKAEERRRERERKAEELRLKKERLAAMPGLFVKLCTSSSQEQLERARNQRDRARNVINDAREQITQQLVELASAERLIQAYENGAHGLEQTYLRQLESLQNIDLVESIDVIDMTILVSTKELLVKHQAKTYRLGKFSIEINSMGRIRMHNLTHKSQGVFDHPNVTRGQACFGSASAAIAQLMADREYTPLVTMLIEYLQSYNPSDRQANITDWPLLKEEEGIMTKPREGGVDNGDDA